MSTNQIRKVALIGGSGRVGSNILTQLLSTSKHEVTVLTRADSSATFPTSSNLTIKNIDLNSQEDLVAALRGHDFLVITLYARAPAELHTSIVEAAVKAGVPRVLPNYFGFGLKSDGRAGGLSSDPLLSSFGRFVSDVQAQEPAGLKWTALSCGFWYEFSLASGPEWFGFDIPGRKVTFYSASSSAPLQRINTSTWEQCGRAIASLVSLPITSSNASEVSLEKWDNKGLYISSFSITQRDMLDSLHRVLGTTDEDWSISYQAAEERYAEGLKQLQGGDMLGFAKGMYARLFFESGEGMYEQGGLDNEALGLPKEDLDVATKRAVDSIGKA